jgi:hypothetical protein
MNSETLKCRHICIAFRLWLAVICVCHAVVVIKYESHFKPPQIKTYFPYNLILTFLAGRESLKQDFKDSNAVRSALFQT